MIALAVFIAYFVIGVWTARKNYGRLRAAEIAKLGLDEYDETKAAETLAWGIALGFIWPVTLIIQIISAKPPVTPQELKARDEAREAYVRELEERLDKALEEK